jgi:hypothetical protein
MRPLPVAAGNGCGRSRRLDGPWYCSSAIRGVIFFGSVRAEAPLGAHHGTIRHYRATQGWTRWKCGTASLQRVAPVASTGAAQPQEVAFSYRTSCCFATPVVPTGASASVSVRGQRGESPLQVDALRLVADRNCVAARRGGEQREANGQSATQVNSIRPARAASLLAKGEAQTGVSRMSPALRGSVSKRWGSRGGGWRRNGRKARHMKQRDLRGPDGRS